MFCQGCGNQIPDNTPFCPTCGTPTGAGQAPMQNQAPVQAGQPQFNPQAAPVNGDSTYKALGIAGMVCGIAGVVLAFLFPIVGFPVAVVGIILSGLSMKKAQGRPNGMGVAGLVCAIVGAAIGLPFCICALGCMGAAGSTSAALSSFK